MNPHAESSRDVKHDLRIQKAALVACVLWLVVVLALSSCTTIAPSDVVPQGPVAASPWIKPLVYQGQPGWLATASAKANYELWWPELHMVLDVAKLPETDWVEKPDGIDGHWWVANEAVFQYGALADLHNRTQALPTKP